jgi:molybdopterin-binding protein
MVTHDRNEAIVLSNRVAVLINGHIHQTGTPAEVFSYPVDKDVAGFIEAGNVINGTVSSQSGGLASVSVGEQKIDAVSDVAASTHVTMFLRHEDITITLPSPQNVPSSARNQFAGKILKVFPVGSQMRITIDCGFPLVALVTKRSWEELGLETGRQVVSSFKASSIHLIPKH